MIDSPWPFKPPWWTPWAVIVAIVFCVAVWCPGCASLRDWNAQHTVELRLVTRAVTGEFLTRHPDSIPVVLEASTRALAVLEGSDASATAAELDTMVMRAIAPALAELAPESQAVVLLLVDDIRQVILANLADHDPPLAPEEVRVQILAFVSWVHEVAEIYSHRITDETREHLGEALKMMTDPGDRILLGWTQWEVKP